MANEEQLAILRQGVKVWNQWRRENPDVRPDLTGANLTEANLTGVNFTEVNLQRAIFKGAILKEANFIRASFAGVDLEGVDLQNADLRYTELGGIKLTGANLTGANLTGANLAGTMLYRANLTEANLLGANLYQTILMEVDLTNASVGSTIFGGLDLRTVRGLDTLKHQFPSTIGIDTLYRSQGDIPEVFLRGCGVPDSMIEYARSLVAAQRPIDYYSVFISYSSHDEAVAQRLHADLQSKGVRCWFAPHNLEIGEVIVRGIDEAIRIYDKLLIILSEASVKSNWVGLEVSTALHREVEQGHRVIFPIRLDDAVLSTPSGWAAQLRSRHIGDFRAWKDHDRYQDAFTRLLRDLKAKD